MNRLPEIDVFRGLLLLMMLLNHIPGPHRVLSYESIGFFNAAEGLVFIAGLVAGLSAFRILQKGDQAAVRRAFSRRSGTLYVMHLLMVLGLVSIGYFVMAASRWGWDILPGDETTYAHFWLNMLRPLYEEPVHAWSAVALFLYQPPFLDILPMYCLFLAATPMAVHLLAKRGPVTLLVVSGSLWILARFHLCAWLMDALPSRWGITGLTFDPLAWQFLFAIGLTVGFTASRREQPLPLRPGMLSGTLALVAAALLVRYTGLLNEATEWGNILLSRSSLGLGRLLNVLAIITLAGCVARRVPGALQLGWVRKLGQNSLPVFIYHVVVVYCADFWLHHLLALPGGFDLAWGVTAIVVASLFLPVWAADAWNRLGIPAHLEQAHAGLAREMRNLGALLARGREMARCRGVWNATSGNVAAGLAIGTFIAFTPTMGIQFALAAMAAWLLRAHLPSALLTCVISNPLTVHYLYPLQYRLGVWMLGMTDSAGDFLEDIADASIFHPATHGDMALWIGSLLLAILAAMAAHWWGRRYGPWFWNNGQA